MRKYGIITGLMAMALAIDVQSSVNPNDGNSPSKRKNTEPTLKKHNKSYVKNLTQYEFYHKESDTIFKCNTLNNKSALKKYSVYIKNLNK